jgi:hypothetical protein
MFRRAAVDVFERESSKGRVVSFGDSRFGTGCGSVSGRVYRAPPLPGILRGVAPKDVNGANGVNGDGPPMSSSNMPL